MSGGASAPAFAGSEEVGCASVANGAHSATAGASQFRKVFIVRSHQSRQPGGTGRPTPVRRTHEPNQASSGGLSGLDASWGSLLAVREEARRRSREVGERHRSHVRRCWDGRQRTQQRRHRAEVTAQVALAKPVVVPTGSRSIRVVLSMLHLMVSVHVRAVLHDVHRVMVHF